MEPEADAEAKQHKKVKQAQAQEAPPSLFFPSFFPTSRSSSHNSRGCMIPRKRKKGRGKKMGGTSEGARE